MTTFPSEIWHEIFALACTDTGLTGRSLSLVSKDLHDISRPFKYQSVAITRWGQLIAFSQTFSQLPDIEKRIKYLFIRCPYPFIAVENLETERYCVEDFVADPGSPGSESDSVPAEDSEEDPDSDLDYFVTESDSESDSECSGSLDSDERQDVLEDVQYFLRDARGKIREDEADVLDYDIHAVFDEAIQALHAILNESSSTLTILTLYWSSLRPLPVHHILPPLPFLDELHLFRCSVLAEYVHDALPTTALFPRLRLLFMSGDQHHRFVSRGVPKFAPNLTHFRFTRSSYTYDLGTYFEDIVVKTSSKWATDQIKAVVRGEIDTSEFSHPAMGYFSETPEAWLCLWLSRVAGRPEAWSAYEEDSDEEDWNDLSISILHCFNI